MSIEEQVREITATGQEGGDKISLAVAIETLQRFIEYLEWLEVQPLVIDAGVTVQTDNTTIRFDNTEDFSEWTTSNR